MISRGRSDPSSSSWDHPTPTRSDRGDGTPRSTPRDDRTSTVDRQQYKQTPISTPSHKLNEWERGNRPSGATPVVDPSADADDGGKVLDADALQEWEDEQKRLDRMWYVIAHCTPAIAPLPYCLSEKKISEAGVKSANHPVHPKHPPLPFTVAV